MRDLKIWLQENLRVVIHRFPRIYKLCQMWVRDYGKWYYDRLDRQCHYRAKLRKMKDSKKGERCFIIGNGPSLKAEDLELLINEDCFAANKIFKIFARTTWRPTYYTVIDWHSLNDVEIQQIEAKVYLFGDYAWRKLNYKKRNVMKKSIQ